MNALQIRNFQKIRSNHPESPSVRLPNFFKDLIYLLDGSNASWKPQHKISWTTKCNQLNDMKGVYTPIPMKYPKTYGEVVGHSNHHLPAWQPNNYATWTERASTPHVTHLRLHTITATQSAVMNRSSQETGGGECSSSLYFWLKFSTVQCPKWSKRQEREATQATVPSKMTLNHLQVWKDVKFEGCTDFNDVKYGW